ncbi:MAG TPA: cell division protein ZipA C-terminal FtsZ-binding domain-containing protein, partial [Gammaproteobacteria bacterium]|nr:cell division protein ZipA C-terminal FtsZ-binding domain-containing protein [Gammaproteobacteria bacterium]
MWELRLILILIGVVFIAAIYLLSRQRKSRTGEFRRDMPTLKESNLPDMPSDSVTGISMPPMRVPEVRMASDGSDTNSEAESKQLILALHVACREQNGFAGANVLGALQSAGLRYGQYRVFHRLN